jgi:hypothetical protein
MIGFALGRNAIAIDTKNKVRRWRIQIFPHRLGMDHAQVFGGDLKSSRCLPKLDTRVDQSTSYGSQFEPAQSTRLGRYQKPVRNPSLVRNSCISEYPGSFTFGRWMGFTKGSSFAV